MKRLEAIVVKHTGSHYLLTVLPAWELFPAVLRGSVRLKKSTATNPVAVGDRVECEVPDGVVDEKNPASICTVLTRDNYVIRKSTNLSREAHIIAANVDRAFIVVTLAFPEVKLPFLDRILVTCGIYGIPATIVLNKVDLLRECGQGEAIADFKAIYEGAGYRIIETSAKTGEGIDALRAALAVGETAGNVAAADAGAVSSNVATASDNVAAAERHPGINLLSGVSGVGKSSLIRALDPSLHPRTAQISLAHLQGKHTTTFYEMFPLASGGYIIDTPGIRSFGLLDIEPAEIYKYFPEMLEASKACRFTPCSHTHEPHCAVKDAVDSGAIAPERYNSYLGMLEENNKWR